MCETHIAHNCRKACICNIKTSVLRFIMLKSHIFHKYIHKERKIINYSTTHNNNLEGTLLLLLRRRTEVHKIRTVHKSELNIFPIFNIRKIIFSSTFVLIRYIPVFAFFDISIFQKRKAISTIQKAYLQFTSKSFALNDVNMMMSFYKAKRDVTQIDCDLYYAKLKFRINLLLL